MATDKTTINRAFNQLFFNFLDDIIDIYPDNIEMKNAKVSFDTFKRFNPTLIIKVWYSYIYVPYSDVIKAGNITFFFEKNYNDDLKYLANSNDISKVIDQIRDPIKNMDDVNKSHSMKYIQNLSKLSLSYNGM
jgi:hypothetical protein